MVRSAGLTPSTGEIAAQHVVEPAEGLRGLDGDDVRDSTTTQIVSVSRVGSVQYAHSSASAYTPQRVQGRLLR